MSEANSRSISEWLKRRKRILIGILTIILIVFMLFVVDFPDLISKIVLIGPWGTLLFVLAYTIAFHFRAYKLKLIFKGLSQPIKYTTSYFSIGATFVINDLTPGKVGDLAKIFIIKDQEDMRLSESVAGIAIERILDLILLFIISCFALIYLYFSNLDETGNIIILGQSIQFYLIIGALLILAVLIFFILLIYKTDFVVNILSKISKKLGYYLERFLYNFKKGIKKFKDHKKELVYIILLGFPSWFFDATIVVIFFYFLGYDLNIFVLVLAAILLFFSKTFPITPGGWGISENIGALFVFIFYPTLPYVEILSIFIIEHLFRSAYLFFYGGYSIFHYNFKLKEAKEMEI